MAKRKTTRRRRAQSPPAHNSSWLVFGLLLGLGIAAVMNWDSVQEYFTIATADQEDNHLIVAASEPKQAAKQKQEKKPEFDFYTMLTDKKIDSLSDSESQLLATPPIKTPAKTDAKQPVEAGGESVEKSVDEETQLQLKSKAIKEKQPSRYIIQVASFPDYQEADRLRAELTMSGFDVNIHSAQKDNQMWHRINLGPYTSKEIALAKQTDLKNQNIASILITQ